MKTNWNLKLLYASSTDPALEKDIVRMEEALASFEQKYSSQSYLADEKLLLKALSDFEELTALISGAKPLMYFYYVKTLDSKNEEASRQINKITDRLHNAFNKVLFFELSLGKLGDAEKKTLLASSGLKKYHYHLSTIFEEAKHHLTEKEERIMNLKSQPAHTLWTLGFEKILNSKSILWRGREIALSEAENMLTSLKTKERRMLQDKTLTLYKEVSSFAEAELVAIATNKKIDDALRGFEKPYSATILSYENSEQSIESLVRSVTDHFDISHRFYKLKRKLLKLPHLEYADRSAPLGKISRKFSFPESVKILRAAFGQASPSFKEILDGYLENGQIDVFPKRGKEGGAYMSGAINQPSFVMLNHVDTFESLMTFAHEMGHAIHTELSKTQPAIYQDYTLSAAETASTLFENFAFDAVFEALSPQEKIVALHNKINGDIATVFRQIAFFNFEREFHEAVRHKGSLSAKEIAQLFNSHMRSYLGPAFKLRELDGYFYATVSHFRRFFYVYTYVYGELISRNLYARYKADSTYLERIISFLKAGGSKSPDAIFRDIGVDTSHPDFWLDGLRSIEKDIQTLSDLTV